MKPVRLPASATNPLPRWGLLLLCLLYILSGLIGRDPWKQEDAAGFGIMWTMANGTWQDWLAPHIVGLSMPQEGPLAYWIGALCIKLFGWLLGDVLAARLATIIFFLLGSIAVWYGTYVLGRRPEAQPLRLAFGGQPEPKDYGRTLADGALLIYLGCLGLLVHSHSTSANALHVSMVGVALYSAARYFDKPSNRAALLLGLTLGLLVLTRGWIVPLALWLGLLALDQIRTKAPALRLVGLSLPMALVVGASWALASQNLLDAEQSSIPGWTAWNLEHFALPNWTALKYLASNGIWFCWPAWPFAAWAVYAWRRGALPLHIALPLTFCVMSLIVAIMHTGSDESILLPLLPPLAMLAAFGLPTMKRGAINAVDWFSVMILTTCAAFIWLGWIAKQTGWPAWLARNAFKLAPGFKPEFNLFVVLIAVAASIGWIVLVHWRISRRPSVLWRAVVLSSGGVILCWLLLMTLWLPWGNYMRSYAPVAHEMAEQLPPQSCVGSTITPAQRASFAYFSKVPFQRIDGMQCDYLLLSGSSRIKADSQFRRYGDDWRLVWEGHRASDRNERFRLYRRNR
ncbi:4-amino-4-deoxy-L-arabinose transferase-like glycosyltransferase [Paucimonas lemoignei]|uniref:4-amino-4-deoxy-L-arabinose transferase-like glycosyltransferase n=1 Tax=Paucimonas lemoignei TaxID=29443 RepID=A0A4R3HWE7_PAULE|nr:glycosyltransferase [Paucimonas lemoignei]TCS36571.1 4-amino-4-deoxy-L-arabinose transferase-like glycosyltransferase [Paucimonas lemoignei]